MKIRGITGDIVKSIAYILTLGVFVVTVLNILTRTRKRVTSRAIRPGITSIGIKKEIHDTITNKPEHQKKY